MIYLIFKNFSIQFDNQLIVMTHTVYIIFIIVYSFQNIYMVDGTKIIV